MSTDTEKIATPQAPSLWRPSVGEWVTWTESGGNGHGRIWFKTMRGKVIWTRENGNEVQVRMLNGRRRYLEVHRVRAEGTPSDLTEIVAEHGGAA